MTELDIFRYRLALAMGRPDVADLCSSLSISQIMGWLAYYALEPWGQERADLRVGVISSMLNTALGGKRTKPEDYILAGQKPKRRKTPQEIAQFMRYFDGHRR